MLEPLSDKVYLSKTLAQLFLCEFCEAFENTHFVVYYRRA